MRPRDSESPSDRVHAVAHGMDPLSQVTDWYLHQDMDRGLCVVGERLVSMEIATELKQHGQRLREVCNALHKQTSLAYFNVEVNELHYRVQREETVKGPLYTLRRLIPLADLELLWKSVPQPIRDLLVSAAPRGGLVIVAGSPGAGKSSTCANTVLQRLQVFGGAAWALEDPPEYPLQGQHGEGVCWQKNLLATGESLGAACREVVRSYPVSVHKVLMVGEIRDDAALELLKAAHIGVYVIATMHADSLLGAIRRLIHLAGATDSAAALDTLASVLRLIVYQTTVPQGRRTYEALVNNDQVGAVIRTSAGVERLENEYRVQQHKLRTGGLRL